MARSLPRAGSASILPENASPFPESLLITLRPGGHGAPLYLIPGLGDLEELSSVVSSMACPNPVVGVEFGAVGSDDSKQLTIASIAQRCVMEIQAAQATGPYYLAGYSFGGLVAIEVARLLRGAGRDVGLLLLIDVFYDRRYWPTALFLKSQVRRVFWYLKKIASQAPGAALAEFGLRARNLLRRVGQRFNRSATREIAVGADNVSPKERRRAAMALYRPSHYPGRITFINTEDHGEFGFNLELLWREYFDVASGIVVPGSHRGLVLYPEMGAHLAAAIDKCLAGAGIPASPPRRS